jgi:hypothetical protein
VAKASSRKSEKLYEFILGILRRASHKSLVSYFSKIKLGIDICCDLICRYNEKIHKVIYSEFLKAIIKTAIN